MKLNDKREEELQNLILQQKNKNARIHMENKNAYLNNKYSKQKDKSDRNNQNEIVNYFENNGDQQQNIFKNDFNNTKIAEYFQNSRRLSCEEDPSVVPKIEISLNECLKESQKEESKELSKTSRKRDFNSATNNKIRSTKDLKNSSGYKVKNIPNNTINKVSPKPKKNLIRGSNKPLSPESPLLSIDSDIDEGMERNNINKTQEISDLHKIKNQKAKSLTEKHKNDIVAQLKNKIINSYMKNNMKGNYKHKIMESLSSMNLDEATYQDIIDKVGAEINQILKEIKDDMDKNKTKPKKKFKEDSFNEPDECDHEYFDICDEFLESQDKKCYALEISEKSKRLATSSENSSIHKNSQLNK